MERGLFFFRVKKKRKEKDLTQRARRTQRRRGNAESAGKREDQEVAFAGDDDSDGAAVGRDGVIAEAEAVKDGDGSGLRDRNFMIRGNRRERGKVDPNQLTGFFLESTLQDDA